MAWGVLLCQKISHGKKIAKLGQWETTESGTAKAGDGAVYDLLPALLARRLEGQEILLGRINPVRFYRVPQDPFRNGIEMLSWAPLAMPYGKKGQVAYYSFRLVITVALVPFDAQPRVYVRVQGYGAGSPGSSSVQGVSE
jgi:hypothetical protein